MSQASLPEAAPAPQAAVAPDPQASVRFALTLGRARQTTVEGWKRPVKKPK